MTSLAATKWILICLVALVVAIINGIILKSEYKKHRLNKTSYTTKYLQYSCFGCLICGVIHPLINCLRFVNGFCYILTNTKSLFLFMQGTFMGFYQLARLHYCFSQSQVYSSKGYPRCLFIIMIIIGALFIAS